MGAGDKNILHLELRSQKDHLKEGCVCVEGGFNTTGFPCGCFETDGDLAEEEGGRGGGGKGGLALSP